MTRETTIGSIVAIASGVCLLSIGRDWLVSTWASDPFSALSYSVAMLSIGFLSAIAVNAGSSKDAGKPPSSMWKAIKGLDPVGLSIVRDAYNDGHASCKDRFYNVAPLVKEGIVSGDPGTGTVPSMDHVVLTAEAASAIRRHERAFGKMK